jgi:hypothetical protein
MERSLKHVLVIFGFILFSMKLTLAGALPLTGGEGYGQSKLPVALVYKGPGSCVEDCSESAAEMARLAGLNPVYVGPEETRAEIFNEAPGGKSSKVSKTMNNTLKQLIREFVFRGGGYVGFCAGGFYSTELISETGNPGLAILPGQNRLYEEVQNDIELLTLNWLGAPRKVYWEGGPFFLPPDGKTQYLSQYQVLALYPNGTPATVSSRYGQGAVVVTGVHPESPRWWKSDGVQLNDDDGDDFDLAVDMIQRSLVGQQ